MKYSTEPPPIYDRARQLWGVNFDEGVVFTYGDTCHTKSGSLPNWLLPHEAHHTEQQGSDPAGWWERYFVDEDFRFKQELECYIIQYKWVLRNEPAGEHFRYLNHFAHSLSSPMYGLKLTKVEAMKLIKKGVQVYNKLHG